MMEADDYPLAGDAVGGLIVGDKVPNVGSISASLYEYRILPGVREVPLSDFNSAPSDLFYAADDVRRTKDLAADIRENGWIDPLIVVVDAEGPYILEGAHRLGALHILGAKSFPALVVVDETE